MTWERFSLVAMCTVSPTDASASSVTAVSGVAAAKLPPSATNTSIRPSRMARIVSTVSYPCSRGGSKENSAASASRNASGIFSQMPMVRSPCTLQWPRIGDGPAPGRPMFPRSSRKLVISRMVATALRCWVRPIAQHTTMLFAAITSSANSSIPDRGMPDSRSISAQSRSRQCAIAASTPSQ